MRRRMQPDVLLRCLMFYWRRELVISYQRIEESPT
jgi:hypothetical protein